MLREKSSEMMLSIIYNQIDLEDVIVGEEEGGEGIAVFAENGKPGAEDESSVWAKVIFYTWCEG